MLAHRLLWLFLGWILQRRGTPAWFQKRVLALIQEHGRVVPQGTHLLWVWIFGIFTKVPSIIWTSMIWPYQQRKQNLVPLDLPGLRSMLVDAGTSLAQGAALMVVVLVWVPAWLALGLFVECLEAGAILRIARSTYATWAAYVWANLSGHERVRYAQTSMRKPVP